jgi:hypothetical protein
LDYLDLCARAPQCTPDQLRSAVDVLRGYMDRLSTKLSQPLMGVPRNGSFEEKHLSIHDRFIRVSDESVSLEIAAPSVSSASMSAVLSLAREDLKGVVLQIDAQELVEWIQWRMHAPAEAERPYAAPMHGEAGHYLFTSAAARIQLTKSEVANLDWVLGTAAAPVLKATRSLCDSWQVHRFKRIRTDIGRDVFAIARVKRDLWRLMIEFARIHDFSNGESEWNIFDYAPGCLKVYTPHESDQFAVGYHLLCYPFNDGLYCGTGDEDIVIGWTAPFEAASHRKISPRETWDAEVAHEWLLGRFIPKVLECEFVHRLQCWKRLWWQPQAIRGPAPQRIDCDAVASSAG